MNKINTTGQLREFLAKVLTQVLSGEIPAENARTITKAAAQINESFYSEVKIARAQLEAGKTVAKLGMLPLND